MAAITHRPSGHYQVRVRIEGRYITKTLRTRAEAERWANVISSEVILGTYFDRSNAVKTRMGDLLERYIAEVTPTKKSAEKEAQRLRMLKREFGHYTLAALQPEVIENFKLRRLAQRSAQTVVHDLNSLRTVIKHARLAWGLKIPSNPADNIKNPKVPRSAQRKRRVSADEERYLLLAARQHASPLLPIMELAVETAMRAGEMLRVRWRDVHLNERFVKLYDTKNDEDRDVPLSSRALALFDALKPDTMDETARIFPAYRKSDCYQKAWQKLKDRARSLANEQGDWRPGFLHDLHFHDFRHEATSRIAKKVPNVIELAAITGHKTLKSLMGYYQTDATELAYKLG